MNIRMQIATFVRTVFAACAVAFALSAHASPLWRATFSGYAVLPDGEFRPETVSYLFNPGDFVMTVADSPFSALCPPYDPNTPSTWACYERTATGPILSYQYSGLVNGGGGQASFWSASDTNYLADVGCFTIGGTDGCGVAYRPGIGATYPPEWFTYPVPLYVSGDIILNVYPLIDGGGEDGWSWITNQNYYLYLGLVPTVVSLAIAPVPEPATLALLGIGLAGIGFARRRKAH